MVTMKKKKLEEERESTPEEIKAFNLEMTHEIARAGSIAKGMENMSVKQKGIQQEAAKQKILDIEQKLLDTQKAAIAPVSAEKSLTTAAGTQKEGQVIPKQAPEMTAEEFQKEAQRRALPSGSKAQQVWASNTGVTPEHVEEIKLTDPKTLIAAPIKIFRNYYENIRAMTGFGGRDTQKVAALKDNYKLATENILKEIRLVSSGDFSVVEAKQDIFEAYLFNAQMESYFKQKGFHNLNYWTGDGKSFQKLADTHYRDLQLLLIELNKAEAAQQLSQQQAPIQQELAQAQLDLRRT